MGGQRRRAGATEVGYGGRAARCYHLVYAGPEVREWAWLDPTELAARTARWWDGRVDRGLATLVARLIDRGEAVRVEVIERPAGPALPPVVVPARLDAATQARLDAATHVLRVEADNPPAPEVGYPGLWSALAVAGAAAAGTSGVWLDAGALRVRPGLEELAPSLGAVRAGDHLLLTRAPEGGGGVLLTSAGLASFGLPELLMFGVPGQLAPAAGLVLQGVAQRLIEGLLTDLHDAARRGELPGELVVTGGHVARAATGARVRDAGAARVQLMYRHPAADGAGDHLAVEPVAADLRRPRAEWLRLLVADLLVT